MEHVKVHGRRLGRHKPLLLPHKNPKVLQLKDYSRVLLPPVPMLPYRDWMKPVAPKLSTGWGMMLNDVLGDCTCAAVGHGVQVLTGNTGNPVTPTNAQVSTMYQASGYVPGEPWTDQGWEIESALKYWKRKGLAGHKILGYLAVDPGNPTMVDLAIELFGFVDIGVDLPLSAQSQNGHWYVPKTGLSGPGVPGSWGGHSIIVANRTPNIRRGITWGVGEWILSHNFWNAYVSECWVVLSEDWRSSKGNTPDGRIDWDQLEKDFQQF